MYRIDKPRIGLVKYSNNIMLNITLPSGFFLGDRIGNNFNIFKPTKYLGYLMNIKSLIINDLFFLPYNFLLNTYKFAKAPGTYCKFLYLTKCKNFFYINLPSKKKKKISTYFFVILGKCSNNLVKNLVFGKASLPIKIKNKRFGVRGIAKNPVDHPHGGKANSSSPELSPWGWVTKKNH